MNVFYRTSRIRAFSLIEMLVVIAILAVLIGLLLTAIHKARSAARKVHNMNNIRQLLFASQNFTNNHDGKLPYADWADAVDSCEMKGAQGKGWWIKDYREKNIRIEIVPCTTRTLYVNVESHYDISNIQNPKLISVKLNEIPGMLRNDWVDGTPYFAMLPYLDYENEFNNTYGPMSSVVKYRSPTYDYPNGCLPGHSITHFGGYVTCDPGFSVDRKIIGWTHEKAEGPISLQYGYSGGKVQSRIKAFIANGDWSADDSARTYPLSFPMFYYVTPGSPLSIYETSYTPYITESPAGCQPRVGSPWDRPDPTYSSGPILPGNHPYLPAGYSLWSNSWGTSKSSNIDAPDDAPWPAVPYYDTVTWLPPTIESTSLIWTGRFDENPPTGVLNPSGKHVFFYPYTCDQVEFGGNYCKVNDYGMGFPPGDPNCAPGGYYHDDDWCHDGEWKYFYKHELKQSPFADGSKFDASCISGTPRSFISGILCVGMLDGSVKTVSSSIDPSIIDAMTQGRAPEVDVE